MRLWSLHPGYLDSKGLVALWREGLLAQKVLAGETRGYGKHPQLLRFQSTSNPLGAIATYLRAVADEADSRGYRFDRGKIRNKRFHGSIPVTRGQIDYEFGHLLQKLSRRNPALFAALSDKSDIRVHPLFQTISGAIEGWEVGAPSHQHTP